MRMPRGLLANTNPEMADDALPGIVTLFALGWVALNSAVVAALASGAKNRALDTAHASVSDGGDPTAHLRLAPVDDGAAVNCQDSSSANDDPEFSNVVDLDGYRGSCDSNNGGETDGAA